MRYRALGGSLWLLFSLVLWICPLTAAAEGDWRCETEWRVRQVMADNRQPGRVLLAKHAVRKADGGEVIVWGEGLLAHGSDGWTGIPFAYTMRIRLRDRHFRQMQYWTADDDEYFDSMYWERLPRPVRHVLRITAPEWYSISASSRIRLSGIAPCSSRVSVRIHARDGRLKVERAVVADRQGRWRIGVTLAPGVYRAVAREGGQSNEVRFAVKRQTGTWSNEQPGVWSWNHWLTMMYRPFAPSVGLSIDAPRFESRVRGPWVWLRGRARTDKLMVSVDHGYNRVVHTEIPVRHGHWAIRMKLKRGVHRAIVRAGVPMVQCWFTVR